MTSLANLFVNVDIVHSIVCGLAHQYSIAAIMYSASELVAKFGRADLYLECAESQRRIERIVQGLYHESAENMFPRDLVRLLESESLVVCEGCWDVVSLLLHPICAACGEGVKHAECDSWARITCCACTLGGSSYSWCVCQQSDYCTYEDEEGTYFRSDDDWYEYGDFAIMGTD